MAGESRSSTRAAITVVVCTFFVGACAAKVSARGGASSSAASAEGTTEHVWNGGESPPQIASSAPAPAPVSVTSSGGGAVCPLTCLVPHKGRIAPAEEARLAEALAPTMEEIRACVHGRSSLTLRFDSASSLTHFGIASDEDSPCLASLRERHPPIMMAGPVTLRCTERCKR